MSPARMITSAGDSGGVQSHDSKCRSDSTRSLILSFRSCDFDTTQRGNSNHRVRCNAESRYTLHSKVHAFDPCMQVWGNRGGGRPGGEDSETEGVKRGELKLAQS